MRETGPPSSDGQSQSAATLDERMLRIEGLLGLKPDLRFAAGSEFWIVQAEGNRGTRALAYWGPYKSAEDAAAWKGFEPHFGHVIVEVPT